MRSWLLKLRKELRADPETEDLVKSMGRVREEVEAWWKKEYLPWFTDHSASHSRRVADYALRLAQIPSLNKELQLTALERYILYVAAWLHDVGMNDLALSPRPLGEMTPEDFEQVRHEHPDRTKVRLLESDGAFGLPADDPILADVIAYTARSHGTRYYKDSVRELKEMEFVRNRPIRGPLLAALLLMADELDLHYGRAKALPGGAKLTPVSEAHAFKHKCVTSASPLIGLDGRLGVRVELTFPSGMPEADRVDVERWITVKLQQQMGLVEPDLQEGFARQASFDRAIKVTYGKPHARRPPLSTAGMAVVRAEALQNDMIDHRKALKQVTMALNAGNVVVVNGAWLVDKEYDVDGREDLLAAAAAKYCAEGATVLASVRLKLNVAGALSDILEEWLLALAEATKQDLFLKKLPPDQVESARSKEIFRDLVGHLKRSEYERVIFVASHIDGLTSADRQQLVDTVVPALNAALPMCAFLFSAGRGTSLPTTEIPVVAVAAGALDKDDLVQYMGRYVGRDAALGSSAAKLDYAGYKAVAQGYEGVIREQVAS